MVDLELDDVNLTGIDEYPPDSSVKLNGPPGTGKTTQSAGRVGRLLRDYDYEIDDVAWVTYRKSLAKDTLTRLAAWGLVDSSELANPSEGPTRYIGTFHAVANRVAGGDVDVAGYYDQQDFCKKWNIRFQKRSPWDEPPGELLFDTFYYCANNLLNPTKTKDLNKAPMIDDLRNKWQGDIAKVWQDWQDYKETKGLIDYYEMLLRPITKQQTPNRDILVVDEYHDATPLMAKLAEYWADDAEVVIFAGDPHQVVNSYAGADPDFYERVDLPEVLLDKTYRVPYEHWSVAERVLNQAHDPPQVERTTTGSFSDGTSPSFRYSRDNGWDVPEPSEERSPVWFVEKVGKDTMFLTRTRKQADGVAKALEKAGVLYQTQNSMKRDGWQAGDRGEMNTRTAVYNALQKIEGLRPGDFNGHGLGEYTDTSRSTNIKLDPPEAAALLRHTRVDNLAQSRDETTEIAQEIRELEEKTTVGELRQYVEDEFWTTYTTGARAVGELAKNPAGRSSLDTRDLEALKPALRRNDGPVGQVETLVYTVHASKGTEAANVIVYDGITGQIQDEISRDADARANECRTWYVALTRASKRLVVLRDGFEWMHSYLPNNLLDMARDGYEQAKNAGVAA
ncbi:AAA family ATPase [Halorussus limi]|uniref:DNA 3'-5' helicase n=1 Tax=Halorussus limi TaxID=2938695 RepID=A0A8U0HQL0_9EURY|nr:UvrD-helicase domain-containing protein [Halorussus limi]UPV72964.1 AAA family ATPase [Halorussus limi]